jgi:hypothetical protein
MNLEVGVTAIVGTEQQAREHVPVLKWLVVNCLTAVAVGAMWHFGLIEAVLRTDHTRVSLLIAGIFVLTALHCLSQTIYVSRELNRARSLRARIVAGSTGRLTLKDGKVFAADGSEMKGGILANHIANLVRKSTVGGNGPFDQTLLLRALADRLRGRQKLGLFVSEGLLRLALLGTAIGFILMLIPISELNSFDPDTLRSALTGMTSGMAVALNVTVTGIASALVLKFQYYLLDGAVAELFDLITETTEVHVVPQLRQSAN